MTKRIKGASPTKNYDFDASSYRAQGDDKFQAAMSAAGFVATAPSTVPGTVSPRWMGAEYPGAGVSSFNVLPARSSNHGGAQ